MFQSLGTKACTNILEELAETYGFIRRYTSLMTGLIYPCTKSSFIWGFESNFSKGQEASSFFPIFLFLDLPLTSRTSQWIKFRLTSQCRKKMWKNTVWELVGQVEPQEALFNQVQPLSLKRVILSLFHVVHKMSNECISSINNIICGSVSLSGLHTNIVCCWANGSDFHWCWRRRRVWVTRAASRHIALLPLAPLFLSLSLHRSFFPPRLGSR